MDQMDYAIRRAKQKREVRASKLQQLCQGFLLYIERHLGVSVVLVWYVCPPLVAGLLLYLLYALAVYLWT
jgi:hypothetical protein